MYGIIDQMVWKKPGGKDEGIGLFLQVMGAPDEFNVSNLFVEAGANWKGPFAGRENDIFGLGVSYLGIGSALRAYSRDVVFYTGTGTVYSSNETVIEATYQYQVAPWWQLQPDLQYVVHPGGHAPLPGDPAQSRTIRNATVLGLRTTITF